MAATYRLQLSPSFTFRDAARVVPYAASLGVSHLYLSPIFESVPGSTHGYDVTDHGTIRGELGGMAGFAALVEAARAAGLGIVLDIVPNHVGVAGGRHPWWRDVLRFGQASRFAPFFDIDWKPRPQRPGGVLVVPVLGRPFGESLEAGELIPAFDGSEIVVRYFDHSFPLAPATYVSFLGVPPPGIAPGCKDAAAVPSLAAALDRMGGDHDDARGGLAEFARIIAREPTLKAWLGSRLQLLIGTTGDPASWDALDELLGRQHYRLAYWRVSAEEVNYRRFFDINDLAAIRQEHGEVFRATHELVARLWRDGLIDGLRVDHVDGLYDPARYLESLQEIAPGAPVWVEKILAHGEELPSHWPIAGTTGYDFLAMAGGLFVDHAAEPAMTAIYETFTGQRETFAEVAEYARVQVAEASFSGELTVLAAELHGLAGRDRRYRDVTLGSFRDAIETLLATFPVYRTYLEGDDVRPGDRELLADAASRAALLEPAIPPQAFAFLLRVLLLETEPGRDTAEDRLRWVHFRRRFQQISGPVMAKGVEDTSFFRYNRLLALNEVGVHPDRFATPVHEFHAWAAARARRWPLTLNATSTHDTKRSEDARTRLSVLSERPAEWGREVRAWARLNDRYRNAGAPDAITEYYLYQSLVASWEGEASPAYVDRIAAHMTKAAREARVHTSWTSPSATFEEALEHFVRAVLDARRSGRFLARLHRWVESLRPAAEINSLALVALKCLVPGIPDVYQGCERPFFALTDPDNRRAVAFSGEVPGDPCCPHRFAEAKPWLTARLLRLRAAMPSVFLGDYRPIGCRGADADCIVAFERSDGERHVVAAVPRLASRYLDGEGRLALPRTLISLPPGSRWTDWLGGSELVPAEEVDLAPLLARVPVVVLVRGAA